MESESRRSNPSVEQKLANEAYRFDFFQAVRLLERISPTRLPVGLGDNVPSREIVRFRTLPSLKFPPSQLHELVQKFDPDRDEQPTPELIVTFMGLIGPLGVLPTHYTELVAERARYKDTAIWEFLDIFSHRLISFFYRAWEKYHFPVAYERNRNDSFTERLYHLIGMGTRGLRGRMSVSDEGLLFYGGLIAQRPHSASAVQSIVGDYFGVPAKFVPFTGQWLDLDDECICRLGEANSRLGVSTVAGSRVWDSQSKFRMRIGPLNQEQLRSFVPSGSSFKPMKELIRFVVGPELDFDAQLVVRKEEVPGCILTTRARRKPMLGWTTWLKTEPFRRDDDQLVLAVNN